MVRGKGGSCGTRSRERVKPALLDMWLGAEVYRVVVVDVSQSSGHHLGPRAIRDGCQIRSRLDPRRVAPLV